MTLRICTDSNPCPSDQPLDNFSSEADDTLDYFSTFFFGAPPPLLHNFNATQCGVTFESTISQLDADQQAAAAAILCNCQSSNTCQFSNNPQTCCVPCPDGVSSTCYTVPGGLFFAANQQAADALAHQQACQLVSRNMVCLSNLPGCTCVGTPYANSIMANVPVTWAFGGGSLPPGVNIAFSGQTAILSGTPTLQGQYTFALTATSSAGPSTTKTFTITVLMITTSILPAFSIGVPYAFQLKVEGGSGNYLWKIDSGSLPPGLVMSNTGFISGTPT